MRPTGWSILKSDRWRRKAWRKLHLPPSFHCFADSHFFDAALANPVDEPLDSQLLRPDAAQRGNGPVQHVIESTELARGLNTHDVRRFLDNAHHPGVALRIAAVLA